MTTTLKGTEKQVKYAEDIKKGFIYLIEDLKNAITKYSKDEEMAKKYMEIYNNEIITLINSYTEASDLINDWKEVLTTKYEADKIMIINNILKQKEIKITMRIIKGMKEEYFVEY